uniref:Cytochrome c oxidase subunit Vb:COX4 n=1 Tax=Echinococcus granulosus TaxID=6210 RepID=A0A068WFW7_ECHGR|nr:cytochrome c oxidase subunit Vb:COX4 [Echinococcus granulosus]
MRTMLTIDIDKIGYKVDLSATYGMALRVIQTALRTRAFNTISCHPPPDSIYARVRNFIATNDILRGDAYHEPSKTLSTIQKELLEQIEEADVNYYEFKVRRGGPTTKEAPNLIPFDQERRIVGCICHEESHHISYLLLYRGLPARCRCGHWFKLVTFDEYEAARDRYWKKIESEPENQKLMKDLNDAETELQKLLEESKSMTNRSPGSNDMLDKLAIEWNKYKNAYHQIRKKIDEACITDIR